MRLVRRLTFVLILGIFPKSIIQAIVNRSNWVRGNGLALILIGTGQRAAKAADAPQGAAALYIEYR